MPQHFALQRRNGNWQPDRVSEFVQRVENQIQQRKLLARGQKVLVAVSGGADSMVLLQVLLALGKKLRWQISVAHFNHRLRGRASDADERLVRQTAKQLRLKFAGGGADVKSIAAQSKVSLEMAARKLRHEFLARTARRQNIPVIALAHHADDQVELFFLRLLRGAGGAGLAGMKWRSPSPADKQISLIRPLLDFSKAELLDFARESKIRFRDDATNFSSDILRNRIRHDLLPRLRNQFQPALDKVVLRLMDIVGTESEYVADCARSWLRSPGGAGRPIVPAARQRVPGRTDYEDLPLAVQRKVLQQELTGAGLLPDFELIEALREAPGKRATVAAGLSVIRDPAGKVQLLEPAGAGEQPFHAAESRLKLSGKAGRAELNGRRFYWRIETLKRMDRPPLPSPRREFFDADQVGGEIILRHWRPGDRFQPIGMKSPVKLQDLFVNAKIPATRRRGLVLAATLAGEIFWVEGLRISEPFKLTSQTRRQLVWTWLEI